MLKRLLDKLFKRHRWEAAETSRLNQAHWAPAKEQSINRDLVAEQQPLRERCAYEISNNSFLAGIVETYVCDVVGHDGPTLQVRTSDTAYNDALEAEWNRWWARPDVSTKLSGTECLQNWVRSMFPDGEYLFILTGDPTAAGNVKTRLQLIAPRRLRSPSVLQRDVTLGVRRTTQGRPLGYFISDNDDDDQFHPITLEPTEIDANRVEHGFVTQEPGQVRGVPWFAPSLQVCADMRDYDKQVLDAARQAADNAVLLWTDHPDAPFVEVNAETEIQRRTISTVPPGWKTSQMKPEQPQTQYASYRAERLRELGRPVQMPLMMVQLDSSGHNYSSARFDGQLYQRGIRKLQTWFSRGTLHRLVMHVAGELALRASLDGSAIDPVLRNVPDDLAVKLRWTWPTPPHVDPQKEASASDQRLRSTTTTVAQEVTAMGSDFETHFAALLEEVDEYNEAGLVHPSQLVQEGQSRGRAIDLEDENTSGEAAGSTNGRMHNGVAP